jgi:hypothetical protein
MGQTVGFSIDYQTPTIQEPFNTEWHPPEEGESYFKSAAGNGFVKGGFLIGPPPVFQFPFYANTYGPFISIQLGTPPDSAVTLADTCDDNPFMTDLVGQTVTGGTTTAFAITAAMYTTNPTVAGTGSPTGPISAIGLMTPI